MSEVKILFADNLHFHTKNFASLFSFIEKYKIEHSYMKPNKEMLTAFGNYYRFSDQLEPYKKQFSELSVESLCLLEYKGINVFDTCKSELLSFLLPKHNWLKEHVENDNLKIIKKAFYENYEDLLLNLSASCYWIDFWYLELKKFTIHDFCCIFSGSNTYCKSLIEVLKSHVTTPIVMESFFTGNEYYMELKYDSLPNNSDIQFKTIFDSYILPEDYYELNQLKIKAINKVILANNKNVKQPDLLDEKILNLPSNFILICGQVLNDYSIINSQSQLNSVATYKSIIEVLLHQTDLNIVFKAHPWEENKDNIRYPLTFNELKRFRSTLTDRFKTRVYLYNHINLDQLISKSKGLITICSQSALEGAFKGIKPIVIGNAFYDGHGFTTNFESPEKFSEALFNNSINYSLSLEEFESFEKFLIVTLCLHLVCVHASGSIRLKEILRKKKVVPVQKNKIQESLVFNNQPEQLCIENENVDSDENSEVDLIHNLQSSIDIDGLTKQLLEKDKSVLEILTKLEEVIDKKNEQLNQNTVEKTYNNGKVITTSNAYNKLKKVEDRVIKNLGSTRLYNKYRKQRNKFFEDVQNPIVKKYWHSIGKKI